MASEWGNGDADGVNSDDLSRRNRSKKIAWGHCRSYWVVSRNAAYSAFQSDGCPIGMTVESEPEELEFTALSKSAKRCDSSAEAAGQRVLDSSSRLMMVWNCNAIERVIARRMSSTTTKGATKYRPRMLSPCGGPTRRIGSTVLIASIGTSFESIT